MMLRFLHHIAIFFFLVSAISGYQLFLLPATMAGLVSFSLQFYKRSSFKIEKITFYLSLVIFLSYLLTISNNGLSSGKLFLPFFIANIAIARSIVIYGLSYKYIQILFYFSGAYFLTFFLLGYHPDEIFSHSKNHISVLFINIAALIYIAKYQKNIDLGNGNGKEKVSKYLLPVILVFIFSFMSQGISGILCSFFLLSMILFHNFVGSNFKLLKLIFFIGFIMLLSWIFGIHLINYLLENSLLHNDLAIKLSQFENRTLEQRELIWGEYFNKLNWQRFLGGLSLNESFANHPNLHSTYLALHARMGLFAFILVFIFLFALLRLYKLDFILFVFLLTILIRGFTDTTFFSGGYYDFVLLTLIIIGFLKKKKSYLDNA